MTETPDSMQAVSINNIGKPRVLKYGPVPMPQVAEGEALVRIHATSVNPGDPLYRSGRYLIRQPLPHILGADLAGEIAQVADDTTGWEVGDRVCASFEALGRERNGSYAEYCAVPTDQLVKLPDTLDYQSAVAAGASFATAWLALVGNGKIKKADYLVIHDAASCVGIASIQIARAKGARVIAICKNDKAARLQVIGADIVLDDAGSDLVRQVKVATNELGATIVLHSEHVDQLADSIDMLAYKGRIVIAAATAKRESRLNIMDIFLKNISLLGSYDSIKPKDFATILQAFAKGTYQPIVDEVLPLSQARKAHEKMEKQPGLGKIILVPDAILDAAKKPSNWIPIE